MSDFTDAFLDLLDCQTSVTGTKTAAINGTTVSVFLEKLTYDEVLVAGGVAESGGFKLMTLASNFATKPPRNAVVLLGGVTLYILSIDENNGIYEITAGDPAA